MKKLCLLLAVLMLFTACGRETAGTDAVDVSSGETVLSSEIEIKPEPEEPSEPESESVSETVPQEEETAAAGKYDTLILVGPHNMIPDDYEVDLVNVQGKYDMDSRAAYSAKELIADAAKAGYDMAICSAYRTVEKSAELYRRKVNQFIAAGYSEEDAKTEAAMWVAPPGTSEHHTGLSMDIVSSDYWGYYSDLEYDYDKFDSFQWMQENCAKYGFILRYPKGKSEFTGIVYEPWHYRYVGKEAAEYIMENGLCLEEYLETVKK